MSLCNASFFVNLAATPPLCDSDSPSLSSTPTRYDTPEPFNPDLLRARLMAAAASLHTLSSQDDSPSSTTETSAGNTNKIIKKRRRSVENNPCAEEKLGSGVSSYAPSASYHHHHPHDTRQVCPSGCSSKFCINCLVETADGWEQFPESISAFLLSLKQTIVTKRASIVLKILSHDYSSTLTTLDKTKNNTQNNWWFASFFLYIARRFLSCYPCAHLHPINHCLSTHSFWYPIV